MKGIGYSYQELTFEKIGRKEELEALSNKVVTTDLYKKKIVIKEVIPDTTAQIFFLKNRSKNNWRDRQSFEIDLEKMSESDLDMLIERITNGQIKK